MNTPLMSTRFPLSLLLAASLAPNLAWGQRYLAGQELSSTLPPSVYVGLSVACPVVADEWWSSGEVRPVAVRELCGLPAEAVAVVLDTQAQTLAGERLQVKVWAADQGEPEHTVLDGRAQAGPTRHRVTTLVNLCSSDICPEGDLNVFSSVSAQVSGWVVGYFQPVTLDDTEEASSGVVMPLATEALTNSFFGTGAGNVPTLLTSTQNAFFGTNAGNLNTTGSNNTFVGANAGNKNTFGNNNAFFGVDAGDKNTSGGGNTFIGPQAGTNNQTGGANTFIGVQAGLANTTEDNNSFIGSASNGAVGITNATALGHRAQVSQSNTLVLGGIAGLNGASVNVNVGIGTDRPARQLHMSGRDAAFRMDRTINTAAFMLVRTDDSGNALKTYVVGTNAADANDGEFIINDLGTAVGGTGTRRMTIDNVGNVGIGTEHPDRQLHLSGANAVFRMDRTVDTAAFMLVRTDNSGNPLKTFVVGTNAAGANNGEFIINDLGASVSGGARRMTINNAGNVIFTGTVSSASSARYKRDIATLTDASTSLERLRGVRFVRIATGRQELGLIAEEVAEVYPELVEYDTATGQVEAVNYSALTAVLLQALKEQQARTASLEAQLSELQGVKTRLADLERRLEEGLLPVVLSER